jgi:hypothetical protein
MPSKLISFCVHNVFNLHGPDRIIQGWNLHDSEFFFVNLQCVAVVADFPRYRIGVGNRKQGAIFNIRAHSIIINISKPVAYKSSTVTPSKEK